MSKSDDDENGPDSPPVVLTDKTEKDQTEQDKTDNDNQEKEEKEEQDETADIAQQLLIIAPSMFSGGGFGGSGGLFSNQEEEEEEEDLSSGEEDLMGMMNVFSKGQESERAFYRKQNKKKRKRLAREARKVTKRLCVKEPAIFRILNLNTSEKNKEILIRHYLRLKQVSMFGGEKAKSNMWLKGVESIPFGVKTALPTGKKKHKFLLDKAEKALDSVTYGQQETKRELLKIFSQLLTRPKGSGLTVIALHGPPGVGKTTLVQEGLAKVMQRPFHVVPLGGAVDSSYLIGHDYTYEGSRWGRIVDTLIEAKCMNPVIFFEELDKVSETPKGQELMNILMHLTDPSQCHRFQDRYFGQIEFDLSDAIIVFSLNHLERVPRILRDRIQMIRVGGYSVKDKFGIAKNFLVPSVLDTVRGKDRSNKGQAVSFTDDVLRAIIEKYTHEAGVRRLKECLTFIVRELNMRHVRGEIKFPMQPSMELICDDIFGKRPSVTHEKIYQEDRVGLCNGLWANAMDEGGLCQIEVCPIPLSKPLDLELTGCQGDVMKESMKCARTVAWNLIKPSVQKKWMDRKGGTGFHIHVPEGAVPKDGPSAGTAITIAILSVLTGVPIQKDIAFTGEIKLTGVVGVIGGLPAKLGGAHKAGVVKVGHPVGNERDLKRVDEEVAEAVETVSMYTIQDAIEIAFPGRKIRKYLI